MSIKAIGFLGSLSGDLVMCSAAAKQFKKQYPDSHLTFACARKFSAILPLFFDNKYIDNYHIWDGYNDWPNNKDKEYINKEKFNIVFDCLSPHKIHNWYNYHHYIEETCDMLGLENPSDLTCHLNPWFGKDNKYFNYVSIAAFPSMGTNLSKTLSMDKWVKIVSEIKKMGYNVIQLGGRFDTQIEGAEKPDLDWVSAAQVLYSSKLQITTDTSWSWIGSAYECNAIGLYGLNYKDMKSPSSHMPINKNASYIWDKNVNDITVENILKIVRKKLGFQFTLPVDEAYSFDHLSILQVKKYKDDNEINNTNYLNCFNHIKEQIDVRLFDDVIRSEEYNDLYRANLKTFNLVDLAKVNSIKASEVDFANNERYKAKKALQQKFFGDGLIEVKLGYN